MDGMPTSSDALGPESNESTLNEKPRDRISVAEIPSRFPSLVIPRASPVPSVRSGIQSPEVADSHPDLGNGQKSPSTIIGALSPDTSEKEVVLPGRKGSEAPSIDDDVPPPQLALGSSPNASTLALKSPRLSLNTPSIFTPSGLSPVPQENKFQSHRFSLLNEPSSLLSVASSTRSSMVSSMAEPDIEEEVNDDMVIAAAHQARLNRPSLVDHGGKSRTPSRVRHFHSLANARPKVSRILGEDLHALATEQGGIPVRALVSPALSSPPRSAPSRLPQIAQDFSFAPTILGQSQDKEASPGGTPVQHPLRANPPVEKVEPLHRASTLPASTKRNRRPTFLPLPIDPSPGRRFERQSIVSTPYPYSGAMSEGHRISPRDRLRASIIQKKSHLDANAEVFTVTLRHPRRLQTQKGLIPIHRNRRAPIPGPKLSDSEFFDDASLATAIIREYRRLRGWPRFFFNARGIVSVRVSCKDTPPQEPPVDEKPKLLPNSAELDIPLRSASLTALSAAEEGRGSFVAHPVAAKAEPTPAIVRRKLEQSLTPLLLHPRSGTAKSTCLSNFWSLVDAQRAKGDHFLVTGDDHETASTTVGADGAVAIELIESWKAWNIGFAIVIVLVLSILATLLWTLAGVGGAAQEVDVRVNLPVHGHSRADTVLKMGQVW